jgi:hypothetical protein
MILLVSCTSAPRKSTVPPLNPETASELLHFNHKADAWLTYVRKQNTSCIYQVDLPDQASHPTEIDIDHLVTCAGRPAPKEFDATVSFVFDPAAQKWTISRFAS